jgi:hypothetical protein
MASNSVYLASAACALAGIDNKRFNEAVAKNFYQCAPEARRGSARKFTEDDVVSLFVYSRLLEQQIPQRLAGKVACQVKSKITENPNVSEVRIQKYSETGKETDSEYSAHVYWIFDVAGIRKHIRKYSEPTKESGRNNRRVE